MQERAAESVSWYAPGAMAGPRCLAGRKGATSTGTIGAGAGAEMAEGNTAGVGAGAAGQETGEH
jgi:hypothetical protein